jgi:hypothetical protein
MTTEKRKRGRPPADTGLTERIALRLLPDDAEQIAALVAKLGFDAPTLTRAALRLGLTALELAPDLLAQAGGAPTKRRAGLKPYFAQQDREQ